VSTTSKGARPRVPQEFEQRGLEPAAVLVRAFEIHHGVHARLCSKIPCTFLRSLNQGKATRADTVCISKARTTPRLVPVLAARILRHARPRAFDVGCSSTASCSTRTGARLSKSLGNVTAPQDVIRQPAPIILRMWVCASDYADDLRIGPEILKTTVETYRKLRNTSAGCWARSPTSATRTGHAAKMPELDGSCCIG